MTCIVAHKSGWMVADCLTTLDGDAFLTKEKIIVSINRQSMVGCAGNSGTKNLIRESLSTSPNFKSDLVKFLRDKRPDVNVLYVDSHQGLLVFNNEGCWFEPPWEFWAIGSTADFVKGYLTAVRAFNEITPSDAIKAIEIASSFIRNVSKETVTARIF